MHDPFSGYQISCDWRCHISRTPPSAGGTDYRMNVGTPIRASFSGVLTNRPPVQYPASGNVAILTRGDGLEFYHLHLSQFVTAGWKNEGDVIGYSGGAAGAPGSGLSTGPHVHVNAYFQGAMRDIHDFFGVTAPAGPGGTPLLVISRPTTQRETPMQIVYDRAQGAGIYLNDGQHNFVHIPMIEHVPILEAYIHDLYSRPIKNGNAAGNDDDLVTVRQSRSYEEITLINRYKRAFQWNDSELGVAHNGSTTSWPLLSFAPAATVDTTALAAALAASMPTMNVAAIAAAVDAVLVDNFAAIPTHFTITGEAK